jgi:hypothetical protein
VRIVFPAERDLAGGKVHDPVIRDSDAMRVASQIVEDMLWPPERSLGVDYPILTEQRAQESMESFLFAEPFEASGKQQFAVTKSVLEPGDELAPKDAAQNFYRQEEGIVSMAAKNRAILAGWKPAKV